MKRRAMAGIFGGVAMVLAGLGCASGPVTRDQEVRILMEQNRGLQDKLASCQQRVAELTAAGAQPKPVVPPVADPFRAVAVRFGKYTEVLPGSKPGDERLKVILEPLDERGEIVKRAGSLDLEALEAPAPGQPAKPLAQWAFPTSDLSQTWINMLSVTGYVLKLPWPHGRRPTAEALILRAKFTALSGEVLTAETQVHVPRPSAVGPTPPARSK
jgi:hypothetical protein